MPIKSKRNRYWKAAMTSMAVVAVGISRQNGESWRYNKIGTALDVSHGQLSRYMSSADYALR